ncbi:HPr family phosphocarrier protein [Filobacillus milosensis]|uniref:HPr family phosphocarrier protein n=1 Tax=Filobacillus milosensis TaxID=94137 RepID=A0A4Y8IQ89_9BACI|nr:HPr family phosphocarrier protein [Filobacillus milosensis]TFB22836.1 HPr family phosphocarrier protein [Filobacillus milosensis]
MKLIDIEVKNETGIRARPAQQLVQEAARFTSDIKIIKGEKVADAKSILGVMTLGDEPGTTIQLQADGADEDEAIERLTEMINNELK